MSNTVYVPQTWIDEANECTPITAERLNHMEQGIKACSDAWDSISSVQIEFTVRIASAPIETEYIRDFSIPNGLKAIGIIGTCLKHADGQYAGVIAGSCTVSSCCLGAQNSVKFVLRNFGGEINVAVQIDILCKS